MYNNVNLFYASVVVVGGISITAVTQYLFQLYRKNKDIQTKQLILRQGIRYLENMIYYNEINSKIKILGTISQLIGNTPLIKLVKLSSILKVDIYVKV